MAIIILSHGSRSKNGNDLSREVAREVEKKLNKKTVFANLQLSEPYFSDVIKELYESGEREFIIHPFFLHKGIHVIEDIPKEIESLKNLYPDAVFKLTDITGKSSYIMSAVIDVISEVLWG